MRSLSPCPTLFLQNRNSNQQEICYETMATAALTAGRKMLICSQKIMAGHEACFLAEQGVRIKSLKAKYTWSGEGIHNK